VSFIENPSDQKISRHDYDITALQNDVRLEILAGRNISVPEWYRDSLRAPTSQYRDIIEGRIRRRAAGHTQSLHDVDHRVHNELAGAIDLPYYVDLVAKHFAYCDRDDRL
jgi:hypothetical protein